MRGLETEGLIWAPSEQDSGEFGPDHLQQLRVEKVLTQAEGAPVTSAHAAKSGVSAEKNRTQNTSAVLQLGGMLVTEAYLRTVPVK